LLGSLKLLLFFGYLLLQVLLNLSLLCQLFLILLLGVWLMLWKLLLFCA